MGERGRRERGSLDGRAAGGSVEEEGGGQEGGGGSPAQ